MFIQTQYLRQVFTPKIYEKVLSRALLKLEEWDKVNPFDTLAFTGVSGAAIAFPLSLLTGKPLILVRKMTEDSHYEKGEVEGNILAKKFVVVDDFIATGETMDKLLNAIKKALPQAQPSGIYLYKNGTYNSRHNWQEGSIPIINPGDTDWMSE